jgi:glycosyltransferase involved in cell wall biosynthesis
MPVRVLHYSTWGDRCGIGNYAADLARELDRLGVRTDPVAVDRTTAAYLSPAEWRAKLAAVAEQARDYDLLHLQHEFSFFGPADCLPEGNRHFFGLLRQLKRAGTPTAITFHTMPVFLPDHPTPLQRLKKLVRGGLFGWTPGRTLGRADWPVRAVVHTRRSRLQLVRAGVDERLIRVVPMGVGQRTSVLTDLSPAEAKARLGLPPGCVLLSLFGFIARYKGHRDAVAALKLLPDNYVLAVVGGPHPEGQDRTLDAILREWTGDPARLVVTGHVPTDTLDLYHAATDICLAPYTDPKLASSAAITWAVSSGKPVVATTIPTFRELAGTHRCLRLCNPRAPHELAWTVRRLAGDEAGRRELVANAAAYCGKASWAEAGRQVAAVYADLLGRPVTATQRRAGLPPRWPAVTRAA